MGENDLLKMTDFADLDVPVDVQVARFTAYTGVVLTLLSDSFEGCVHKNPLRGLIEEAWRNAAKEIGTYPWKLGRAEGLVSKCREAIPLKLDRSNVSYLSSFQKQA
jgi:hypothetical protein